MADPSAAAASNNGHQVPGTSRRLSSSNGSLNAGSSPVSQSGLSRSPVTPKTIMEQQSPGGGSQDGRRPEYQGWLYKWTNIMRGYQKRWFVLSNGLLSYYRTQGEIGRTMRGSISVQNAVVTTTEDGSNFVVSNATGSQTFYLRAANENERQKWIRELELAKAQCNTRKPKKRGKEKQKVVTKSDESSDLEIELCEEMEESEEAQDIKKEELEIAVKGLHSKMEDLSMCSSLIGKHSAAFQNALGDLGVDQLVEKSTSMTLEEKQAYRERVKTLNERAALLKLTTNAMTKASSEFVRDVQVNGRRWQRLLRHERELRKHFEDSVEQFAKQISQLENNIKREQQINSALKQQQGLQMHAGAVSAALSAASPRRDIAKSVTSGSGSEDEFEDAVESPGELLFSVVAPPHNNSKSGAGLLPGVGGSIDDEEEELDDEDLSDEEKGDRHNMVNVNKNSDNLNRSDSGSNTDESRPKKIPELNVYQKTTNSLPREEGEESTKMKEQFRRLSTRKPVRQRRSRIPDRPNQSISLWGIIKNSIGKDLSKIPVPVNFSEPISMLQRLAEDFEYSDLLDKAALCENDCEQMVYLAAFTVSSYGTTGLRSAKPFNPLLGETYEFDRSDDKGFKGVSEQVSHHPPMVAQHCESSTGLWKCWQEFSMRSKFKGKYLEVEPLGIAHCVFPKTGNHYTWRKVKTVVHNIVIGKLWIDQVGEMSIINHRTDDKCHMKFEPYSYFGGTPKQVKGTVVNAADKVEWVLNGTWDCKLEGAKVLNDVLVKGKSSLEVGPSRLLWSMNKLPEASEKYYNFGQFSCELNEMEDGVAPTDSRLRPDQRLMEEARWDEANEVKVLLEEKQRSVRRQREEESARALEEGRPYEGYHPVWFKREPDEQQGGKLVFVYDGAYWEAKDKAEWAKCPDIYLDEDALAPYQ